MPAAKIAITIDRDLLVQLDQWVKSQRLPSRSRAIQDALQDKLKRLKRTRLARECAKLDAKEEKTLAEMGLAEDVEQWPTY